ncbi:hypothetical protein AAH158_04685 [Parabacteroides merdae]|uniref:hypothetical protein n=1 Tax=Parabacteroides merdae TaxID=46503 RepID=UPI0039B5EA50
MIGLNKIGLNQVQLNRLRLNAPFPTCRKMAGGGGSGDGFPVLPGDVTRWHFGGLTNEMMAAMDDPRIEDADGKGRFLSFKNFAWKGMSGVGGYGDENYQTFYKFTLDDYVFIASPPGVEHMNFTFRVTGLQPGNKLTLAFFGTTNTVYGTWDKDGIYTVDADIVEAGKPTYFYNGYGATRGEFTIEILPLYPGALVFDGVDDYGVCNNFPILTKEKGYTVVALRQWIEEKNDSTALVSNCKNWGQNGAFLFEYNNLRINFLNVAISFGYVSSVDRGKSPFSYQTSKLYNGKNIEPGSLIGSNELIVGKGNKDFPTFSKAAIWELVFLDHDATEEELTKIKDYFVKTYPWLFPDQAWTVVGKTNEDEDRATIANITGNGNDLVLSNFGFIEGSGYNKEGEYAGYLVTDGVDDEVRSAAFTLNEDWTIVGNWEFITNENKNAGLTKVYSFYLYNRDYGIFVYKYINAGQGFSVEDVKSLKAICSDGRIYLNDWQEIRNNIEQEATISKGVMAIGYFNRDFTKMAFKNLGIYNNQLLSKDECIKAYSYLQTLKAK